MKDKWSRREIERRRKAVRDIDRIVAEVIDGLRIGMAIVITPRPSTKDWSPRSGPR